MAHPARRATVRAAFVAALLVAPLAACKGQTTVGPGTTVTVTPSSAAASSTSSGPSTPAPSSSPALTIPAPVALGTPRAMSKLSGQCDDRLPDPVISRALGGFEFEGDTQFVVGLPDRKTGRVGYLNCRYGVDAQAPKLEINVALYRTIALAKARIAPTISDFAAHDGAASSTTVSGVPATVLTGGTDTGYGPTVVLAYGQRTVAVTLGDGVLPAASVPAALKSLASVAAKRTSA